MKKGRKLELVLEEIEKVKNPCSNVRSPEKVIDKVTGEKREIDIGIRTKKEGKEVFIAIECRDREVKN